MNSDAINIGDIKRLDGQIYVLGWCNFCYGEGKKDSVTCTHCRGEAFAWYGPMAFPGPYANFSIPDAHSTEGFFPFRGSL